MIKCGLGDTHCVGTTTEVFLSTLPGVFISVYGRILSTRSHHIHTRCSHQTVQRGVLQSKINGLVRCVKPESPMLWWWLFFNLARSTLCYRPNLRQTSYVQSFGFKSSEKCLSPINRDKVTLYSQLSVNNLWALQNVIWGNMLYMQTCWAIMLNCNAIGKTLLLQ